MRLGGCKKDNNFEEPFEEQSGGGEVYSTKIEYTQRK